MTALHITLRIYIIQQPKHEEEQTITLGVSAGGRIFGSFGTKQ